MILETRIPQGVGQTPAMAICFGQRCLWFRGIP